MYEFVSAGAGIGLYFLAARDSTVLALGIVIGGVAVALIGTALGGVVGARQPSVSAGTPWFWSVLLLLLGAALAWGAIVASASVIAAKGDDPNPNTEAVASAAIALIGVFVGWQVKLADRLGVEWVTRQMLRIRYGRQFAAFPKSRPLDDPVRLAYQAIRDDELSAPPESISGWGYRARRRRFEVIASAIAERQQRRPTRDSQP